MKAAKVAIHAGASASSSRGAPTAQELAALDELKHHLHYPTLLSQPGHSGDSGATGRPDEAQERAINAYLLRFLRSKNFSIPETVGKLNRRRAFERSLTTVSLTPNVVSVLRSGAVSIVGCDNFGRPILYIRMSGMDMPPFDTGDPERLTIVLMEYMQAQCSVGRVGAHRSKGGGCTTSSLSLDNKPTNGRRGAGSAECLPCASQFTMLVNEEHASWHSHEPLLDKASALHTLVQKYYPELIGLVLVVGAAWSVRQGLKAALAHSSSTVKECVQLIARTELPKYMDASTIPCDLGGRNQHILTPAEISESVLRHWYAYTSYIQLENINESINQTGRGHSSGENARPLWKLPPHILNSTAFLEMERLAVAGWNPGMRRAIGGPRSTRLGPEPMALSYSDSRNFYPAQSGHDPSTFSQLKRRDTARLVASDDDGMCSALSATDGDLTDTHRSGLRHAHEWRGEDSATSTGGWATALSNDPRENTIKSTEGDDGDEEQETEDAGKRTTSFSHQLLREKERCLALEKQLRRMTLGVAVEDRVLSDLEYRLRAVHDEVNTMVGDIVLRAKNAEKCGSPATLWQLLDATAVALNAAINERQKVPAMALAQPPAGRQPRQSYCTLQ